MSGNSETPQMNSRNKIKRTAPSTRLNAICPPRAGFAFLSSVAASSGKYLYMKMKNARERMILPVASHPLIEAAFSRVCDRKGSPLIGSASLGLGETGEGGGSPCVF